MKSQILHGDCRKVLKTLPDNSIDSVVTDPPYGLSFMGKDWDHGVPGVKFWVEILRVSKPGAFLLAFGGTRTFHRLACAIEDAGWEIRDCVMWVYGSGFPKSLDVSKAIDKMAGAKGGSGPMKRGGERLARLVDGKRDGEGRWGDEAGRDPYTYIPTTDAAKQWQGFGTALKPAWEPIIVARKPIEGTVAQNVLKWGVGALNVDGCRVGTETITQHGRKETWSGSMSGKNYAQEAGTNPHQGRWPANVVHDGSEEVVRLFPQNKTTWISKKHRNNRDGEIFGALKHPGDQGFNDSGSAARFFYTAKASKSERWAYCKDCKTAFQEKDRKKHWHKHKDEHGSKCWKHIVSHPTVKPLNLMEYLVRLVTPKKGIVLDPFCGSGTTCLAAKKQGYRYVGVDKKKIYTKIAEAKLQGAKQKRTLFG